MNYTNRIKVGMKFVCFHLLHFFRILIVKLQN